MTEIEIKTECECCDASCSESPRPRFRIVRASKHQVFCEDLEKAVNEGYLPYGDLQTTVTLNGDSNEIEGKTVFVMLLEDEIYSREYGLNEF